MASQNRLGTSEDVNGEKWDRCLTDTIVKTGLNSLYSIFIENNNLYFSIGFDIGHRLFSYSLQT